MTPVMQGIVLSASLSSKQKAITVSVVVHGYARRVSAGNQNGVNFLRAGTSSGASSATEIR